MKIILKFNLLFLFSFLFTRCVVQKEYGLNTPEEAGMLFTQLTTQEETGQILGPNITRNGNRLQWDAQSMIGLSPDSQFVAYIARTGGYKDNIYLKRTKGGSSIIQRTFKDGAHSVSFSPDSKRICFNDFSEGNGNVFMMNASEGSAIQQITNSTNSEYGPVFSPDGKNIFFTKAETQVIQTGQQQNSKNSYRTRYYIWGYNIETALLTQYAEGLAPAPLPNGKSLLITRINKETLNGEIWLIDVEKGIETLILGDRVKGYSSPQISSDGRTIICVGTTPATKDKPLNLDIYKLNIDGTGLTQITYHPEDDVSPQWSPDGKAIYFISSRGNPKKFFNLWKVDIR